MSSINRVVKNTWILYIRMALTVFLSLYATRLTLSALGVTDFGLFNLVGGVIAMLTFLNNAMASATQRFMSFAEGAGDSNRLKQIFNVSIVLHILIAIIVFIILEVVGMYLFDKVLTIPYIRLNVAKTIFQFTVLSTVFTIISVPYDAVINARENMLFFAIVGIIEAVFKLGIALFLSVTPYDKLITFGLLMAVLSIILLFIRRIYCHWKYEECQINFKEHFSKSTFNEMSSFAGWSFLGASTSMIANYGQGIVMNMFFGPIVNAAQGIANQVSGQLGVFSGTMLKALNPLITKSEGAGNRSLMLKASIFGNKISFFLLLIFFIPVFIEMPFIFKLWLKNPPLLSIIFCRLLLIRNLIDQFSVTLSSSISAVGNIRSFQIAKSIITPLPLIISFILFQQYWPAYSIYVAFILYSVLDCALVLYFANKYCNLLISNYLKDVVLRCLIVLTIVYSLAALPSFIFSPSIFRLLVIGFISVSSLFIITWKIGFKIEEQKAGQEIFIASFNKINAWLLSTKLKFKRFH